MTEMLLGVVFRKLYPLPLFFLNISLSSGVLLYIRIIKGEWNVFKEIRTEAERVFRIIRRDLVLRSIFCFFLLSFCWLLFTGYLFPSYSWDALYYHLPMVGQIIQSGAIQENPTPSFIQQYINIFSKNINLLFLWNVIFLKSTTIVDLSQLFFTIAGVLTVYSMGMKLKLKENFSIYASLLFFFTPVLILQSTANYVDAAVSILFLISVNFLLYDISENSWGNSVHMISHRERTLPILLSGLSAGILLGSKPTSPLFFMVLTGSVVTLELLKHWNPFKIMPVSREFTLWQGLKTYLSSFIIPALLIGGYWYARNWVLHSNPVYYMEVSVFNITLFKGLRKDWVEPAPAIIQNLNYFSKLIYVWIERVAYYLYDSRLSGFGPLWFILFLPAILLSLILAAVKKNYRFLVMSIILVVTFLLHPRNWTTRYVIFIVGLGTLSFGYIAHYFEQREKILKILALLLAGYTFFSSNSPCVMPDKVKEFLLLPAHERTLTRHKPFNIDTKVRNEYGYWMWIEKNVSRGDTLGYAFEMNVLDTEKPFFLAPLWNREFSNRVVHTKAGSYNKWIDILKKQNVTYVLIRKGSKEDRWVDNIKRVLPSWMVAKDPFSIVYSDKNYKILRFHS